MRMRAVFATAILVGLMLPGRGLAKAESPTHARDEVIRLEKEWSQAFLRHDTAAISRILADDYVGIDGRGVVGNKSTEITEAKHRPKANDPVVLGEKLSDIRVRVYGNASVLTALNTVSFRTHGKEDKVRYRRTTVWLQRDGRWQCVSFHASRVMTG